MIEERTIKLQNYSFVISELIHIKMKIASDNSYPESDYQL